MGEITEYRAGSPCWVELWTPDRPASMDFYASVFGWTYRVAPPEQHSFTIATLRDKTVAGMLTPPGNPAAPTVWVTYLAVADLDATMAAVTAHGGQLLTPAITVPGDADIRIALAMDPAGGMAGAWEAKRRNGAELANEPGTQVWNELWTPDPAAARAFYAAAFGIENGAPVSPDFDYTTFLAGGRVVGGIGVATDGGAARWNTYFAVDDPDASAKLVASAGGTVTGEPRDSEFGRIATCRDPHGAEFFLISTPLADEG